MRIAMATKFVAWEVPTLEALKGSKVYNLSNDAPKDVEHHEGGAHNQAAYRKPYVLRHLSEICRCRHIFAVFDFLFF